MSIVRKNIFNGCRCEAKMSNLLFPGVFRESD